MAARKDRTVKPITRERIRTSLLIDRLQDHAEGKIEMTATQVRAAETLIDRTVPKLQSIQHSGDPQNPVGIALIVQGVSKAA